MGGGDREYARLSRRLLGSRLKKLVEALSRKWHRYAPPDACGIWGHFWLSQKLESDASGTIVDADRRM